MITTWVLTALGRRRRGRVDRHVVALGQARVYVVRIAVNSSYCAQRPVHRRHRGLPTRGPRSWRRCMPELLPLEDALRELVFDGDSVALEGFTHLIPFAAGHELLRQGRQELVLIRMTPDVLYDQIIGMGVARKLIFSYGGNPGVGPLHRFRDAIEQLVRPGAAAGCGARPCPGGRPAGQRPSVRDPGRAEGGAVVGVTHAGHGGARGRRARAAARRPRHPRLGNRCCGRGARRLPSLLLRGKRVSGCLLECDGVPESFELGDEAFGGAGGVAAAIMARMAHNPELVLVHESGTVGAKPTRVPLSIGDGALAETAAFVAAHRRRAAVRALRRSAVRGAPRRSRGARVQGAARPRAGARPGADRRHRRRAGPGCRPGGMR